MAERTAIPETMRAVVLTEPTRGEDVALAEVPVPSTRPGWVLVRVCAFGMNHSEQVLREQEIRASYIKKPIIPGIECVGEVADPGTSGFAVGQKVASLMGGMGRSFDGSYAEYVLVPERLVFPVETALGWAEMAAVPETYFTAWGSLTESLQLAPDDVLLIRGATCALGYAAIQLAKAAGVRVIGTTHRASKLALLEAAGCDECVLDEGSIQGKVSGVTKALELIGVKTVKDTMGVLAPGGIVCVTGILGGVSSLERFDPIKDIPNGVFLTGFFSNYPTAASIARLFAFFDDHSIKPLMGATFPFSRITDACIALDAGSVQGKIVVVIDG